MFKLLIDTCVWLDFAKITKGDKVLGLLEEFLEKEEVALICPEIILSEFDRNKDRIVTNAGKSISSHRKKAKKIVDRHGSKEIKQIVLSELNNIDHKIPTLEEEAFSTIQRIQKLLNRSEKIPINDDIKLRSAQRAIDNRAPFHSSKNSMEDAIIIESYQEYRSTHNSDESTLMFITHNKNDFSLQDGNQKEPHNDLKNIFDSTDSHYFINLSDALNKINSELVEQIEFEKEWFFEPRSLSEILEVEDELVEKIWYNRHKLREHSIKSGKIKIVKREDYDLKNSRNTIVKEIWEGAKKTAKKVEDKYGNENLFYDDFEWGMLNGKLSALRWVIGDEWDNLDT